MTWLQILALAGIMGTFLGIGLALAAYFNGKHIKEGVSQISELLTGMEQSSENRNQSSENRHKEIVDIVTKQHKQIVEIVTQQHKDVVELLKKGFGELYNK